MDLYELYELYDCPLVEVSFHPCTRCSLSFSAPDAGELEPLSAGKNQ